MPPGGHLVSSSWGVGCPALAHGAAHVRQDGSTRAAVLRWDYVGGPGSTVGNSFGSGKVLVINHTYRIHEQIVGCEKYISNEN